MALPPPVGIQSKLFGWPIRTKIETHKVGIRWKFSLTDGHGNQLGKGSGFVTKSQALLAAMNCKRAARARRISDGV